MKKAKNKAKNHEGKITRNRKVSCGSNPTPRTNNIKFAGSSSSGFF